MLKLKCTWNEKMKFTGEADGLSVSMDTKSPVGSDSALTPKQLTLAGVCGCTAMDVVGLLRKFKQNLQSFTVEAEAPTTEGGHPVVFKEIKLLFRMHGPIEKEKALEAVKLSQTKYCGVSAMLSKAAPITYTVELNGEVIGDGHAQF